MRGPVDAEMEEKGLHGGDEHPVSKITEKKRRQREMTRPIYNVFYIHFGNISSQMSQSREFLIVSNVSSPSQI